MAEVLITLGIIGVVAAITLPVISANVQKHILKNQFKHAYNIVFNGFRQAEVNLGYHPMCYYGDDWIGTECIRYDSTSGTCLEYAPGGNPTNQNSDCAVFRQTLLKTLKVIKVCEGNGVADGCIPEYKGYDTIVADNNPDLDNDDILLQTSGASAWRENSIHTRNHIWVLSDGIIIIWYASDTKLFALDINGKKGPNKWGYDVFQFSLTSALNKPLWLRGGGANMVEKGGVGTTEMMQEIAK